MLKALQHIIDARATWIIAVINIAMYLTASYLPADKLVLTGNSVADMTEPWRFLSHTALHLTPSHLAINCVALILAGSWLESKSSWLIFTKSYIAGGICGGVAFAIICTISDASSMLLAGSSAAVLSVAATAVFYDPRQDYGVLFKFSAPVILILYLLGNPTENAGGLMAHIGGFVAGTTVAYAHKRHSKIRRVDPLIHKAEQSGYASLTSVERHSLSSKLGARR